MKKVKRLIKLIRCGDEFVEVEKDYVLKDNEVNTGISRMVDIDYKLKNPPDFIIKNHKNFNPLT